MGEMYARHFYAESAEYWLLNFEEEMAINWRRIVKVLVILCAAMHAVFAFAAPQAAVGAIKYTFDDTLGKVVQASDSAGHVLTRYSWAMLPNCTELISADVLQTDGTYKTYYAQGNGQCGQIVVVTDQNGAIAGTQSFDAFGVVLNSQGVAPNDPFPIDLGFRGEQTDTKADFVYLHDRWYDPKTGRFVSMDPASPKAQQPATINRYTYSQNDPVNKYDPTGRYTIEDESEALEVQAEQVAQTFGESGAQAGGRMMSELGKATENAVQRLIDQCLKPGAKLSRPGKLPIPGAEGNAVPDFLLTMGNKAKFVEVKFSLGAKSSEKFIRAANQMKAALQKDEALLVVFRDFGKARQGQMKQIVDAVGGAKAPLQIANGFAEMAGFLGEFLIEGCLK